MSHQSGIRASDALVKLFHEAASTDKIRLIKVSVDGEEMVAADCVETKGAFDDDFARVSGLLDPRTPCVVLVRLDSSQSEGGVEIAKWMSCTYVPDAAPVRLKMLTASSRATLLKDLGDSKFIESIHGTVPSDFTLAAFHTHVQSKTASVLSDSEKRTAAMKRTEVGEDIAASSRRAHVAGLDLRISPDLEAALLKFEGDSVAVIQVWIDIPAETLCLASSSTVRLTPENLALTLTPSLPRFLLFRFGTDTLFVYYCPPGAAVKEKMIYSATKVLFIQAMKSFNIIPVKRYEFDDPQELDTGFFDLDLRPAVEQTSRTFSKPARPGRK